MWSSFGVENPKLESIHVQELYHKHRVGNISPLLCSMTLQMIHNLYGATAHNVRQIFVSENERLQKSMKYFSSTLIFSFISEGGKTIPDKQFLKDI